MRLMKRNTTAFEYQANLGEQEVLENGLHAGHAEPVYDTPVRYRGNISVPSGEATDNLFGINTNYTHVLLMDKPDADIREDGLVIWNGDEYDVKAVRRSLNVLSVALRKRTRNRRTDGD